MQTIEISIWVIRSTFKGRSTGGWEGDLQKCDCPIQERVQIGKLRNLPCPLNVDPIVQIEVFIVCTKRLVCTENFHVKAIMSENKTIYYRHVFENKTMQVTMHLHYYSLQIWSLQTAYHRWLNSLLLSVIHTHYRRLAVRTGGDKFMGINPRDVWISP